MPGQTPSETVGPFFHDALSWPGAENLVQPETRGERIEIVGRVLDGDGQPVPDALVEIWQANAAGRYAHPEDARDKPLDPAFSGFGRCATGSKGEYRFRTIKPVPYPGRTPHIHVMVKKDGRRLITTQIFVNGHPQNDRDGVLRDAGGPLERELVLVDFKPIKESKIGELSATFDIVLGATPNERPR